MAALHAAILAYVPAGGAIVAAQQVYGVTRSLLDWLGAHNNVKVAYVDFLDVERTLERIETVRPQAVLCEVLTNPLARIIEIDRIGEACAQVHAALLVDNTFATPYLLRPSEIGATAVIHSTTKFLNGHGDVTGGVVAGPADAMQAAFQVRKLLGAVPSAFDAWLTLRGLRTFSLRMRQQCTSALTIAEWLFDAPGVGRVYYPGLGTDDGHEAAGRLFGGAGYGSMIAFDVEGVDRADAFAFVEALKLIRPVTSLGDVYSLVLHPASASHRALTPEQRATQGILEGTLRLSVGIEAAEDLIADLEQALASVS
jgi:cystathionine gamma-synthase/methionine-gamma-lyase